MFDTMTQEKPNMSSGVERSNKIINTIGLLVLISILTSISSSRITGHFFGWDPLENTIASLSLINTGSIADVDGNPTNLREPVPIIIHAAYLRFLTNIPYAHPIEEIIVNKSHRASISKVNLVYVWFTLFGVLILSIQLTKKFKIALAAILLSWFFFLSSTQHLYSPHTEIAASMFLMFVTISMVRFYRKSTIQNALILGLFLGLLSLTKMPATYVSLVAIFLLTILIHFKHDISSTKLAQVIFSVIIAFSLVLTPWVLRNHFSSQQENSNIQSAITQRGGNILNSRANLTKRVLANAPAYFYVFAPMSLKESLFEHYLGFKRESLWPGAKYDVSKFDRPDNRFKQEAIVAGKFYRKKEQQRSGNKKVSITIKDLLNPQKKFVRDENNKKKGLEKIKNSPLEHIQSAVILAWRGMWSFSGKSHPPESYSLYHVGNFLPNVIVNFFCFLSLLLMPLVSLVKKNYELFAFSMFGVGYFWIYALFSHFIPRYSAPLIPITIIATLVVLQKFSQKLLKNSKCL